MKSLQRGFGPALVMAALVGLSGCGADNESTAQQLQAGQGAAPAPDVSTPGNVAPQASNYAEYAKQQQQVSDPSKSEYSKSMQKKK